MLTSYVIVIYHNEYYLIMISIAVLPEFIQALGAICYYIPHKTNLCSTVGRMSTSISISG